MQLRDEVVAQLHEDLIGPRAEDELLVDRPSDVYLTGILFPQQTEMSAEEMESLTAEGEDQEASADDNPLDKSVRPATAGVSFAVTDDSKTASVSLSCGQYLPVEVEGQKRPAWKRRQIRKTLTIQLSEGSRTLDSGDTGVPGLNLFLQGSRTGSLLLVTAVLINANKTARGEPRQSVESKTFFQVHFRVEAAAKTRLVSRPSRKSAADEDGRVAALLYRDAIEFATGHTCSADWDRSAGKDHPQFVEITWIPRAVVPSVSSDGHEVMTQLSKESTVFSAEWLAKAQKGDLIAALKKFVTTYSAWIDIQKSSCKELDPTFLTQATANLRGCEKVAERMMLAIDWIEVNPKALTAFQLANKAMAMQRKWNKTSKGPLTWRPFQLGFLLLSLRSASDPQHPDRGTMDLLWFPTGGGKTEAYLGLLAFVFFFRRLRCDNPDDGRGVAALMRYTLRLLTTQQFQRATALVLACDHIRSQRKDLGAVPFSIGLWVGGESVPNDFKTASEALSLGEQATCTPVQLRDCPCCNSRLKWTANQQTQSIEVSCSDNGCLLKGRMLPIWTVDEDVYREAPTLVIGTIDKFAQIVRKPETAVLIGADRLVPPPDLIIQDELHLISGPLGTLAGLYEIAIDFLCSRKDSRPKIIGSTATIRRASDQIKALFARSTCQFPPPGIHADDSCFATKDPEAPGRLYVGVTTAGRSAKFTLQAVCASLLQKVSCCGDAESRDPYWTLVEYFNSLRELGGAVVLMQDDVPMSMKQYAAAKGEQIRKLSEVKELTSRVSQLEVRDMLMQLERKNSMPGSVDVLLASNMISVGVDISRLGLMVVNGQPKGISEYIQATSRVGRGTVPGLVVVLYNNGKARDRSHYETFVTWHSMLYREVDSTSVTPFASRARDKALHAVLVALARHSISSMRASPVIPAKDSKVLDGLAEEIVKRCHAVDPSEAAQTAEQLAELLAAWRSRVGLKRYWDDFKMKESLLVSAERAAKLRACGLTTGNTWPTPNSMRNVEPSSPFRLAEKLASDERLAAIRTKGAVSAKQ